MPHIQFLSPLKEAIPRWLLPFLMLICLLFWWVFREKPLKIQSFQAREAVEIDTPLHPAPVIADVYAAASGFGQYWSARTQHEREGVVLGRDVKLDWNTVEPRKGNQALHVVFHTAGMKINPGIFQDAVQKIFNRNLAQPDWGWQVRYAAIAAEVIQTDLAVEMAAAWVRLAPPDQFVEAYARMGVVLGNAGRNRELDALARFSTGAGDPLCMRPRILPEIFPVMWAASEETPAGLWQRHQWFLLMNERKKAGQALSALEVLAADEHNKDRFLSWFRNNRQEARQRWERLGGNSRQILRETANESLPALAEVLQFYQHLAKVKDYEATLEPYDDEALFSLIEAFGDALQPASLEYADVLLYAIEKRRLDRWDWTPLHLTHAGQLIANHYGVIRAHPVFRIALAQAAYAPELLDMPPQNEGFKATRVNILNHATLKIYPAVLRNRFDAEAISGIFEEVHPYFEIFREDADYFADKRQTGGIRRDFYRRYFEVERALGLVEENFDKWWDLAKTDPQVTVREQAQTHLQFYYGVEKKNVEKTLEVAELMFFHPLGQTRLDDRVGTMCFTAGDFRRDAHAMQTYVQGMIELMERLENRPEAKNVAFEKHRAMLTRFMETP